MGFFFRIGIILLERGEGKGRRYLFHTQLLSKSTCRSSTFLNTRRGSSIGTTSSDVDISRRSPWSRNCLDQTRLLERRVSFSSHQDWFFFQLASSRLIWSNLLHMMAFAGRERELAVIWLVHFLLAWNYCCCSLLERHIALLLLQKRRRRRKRSSNSSSEVSFLFAKTNNPQSAQNKKKRVKIKMKV